MVPGTPVPAAAAASGLLHAWERALEQPPPARPVALLAGAIDRPMAWVAALPLGSRDAELLRLHEYAFGPELDGLAACPGCGELVELTIASSDILAREIARPAEEGAEMGAAGGSTGSGGADPSAREIEIAGCRVRFRLPTTDDLLAVAGAGSIEAARLALLARCLLTTPVVSSPAGGLSPENGADNVPAEGAVAGLQPQVVEAVAAAMSQADPLADISLDAACVSCGQRWLAALDVGAFVWAEIHDWAMRLLREVHVLASAYGWSEADVIAMSPLRRRAYLEILAG